MKIFKYITLLHRYNSLKLENERLKELSKTNLFNKVLKAQDNELMCESLKKENKRLREVIKILREQVKQQENK